MAFRCSIARQGGGFGYRLVVRDGRRADIVVVVTKDDGGLGRWTVSAAGSTSLWRGAGGSAGLTTSVRVEVEGTEAVSVEHDDIGVESLVMAEIGSGLAWPRPRMWHGAVALGGRQRGGAAAWTSQGCCLAQRKREREGGGD